jgi:methionine-rich copper-binding protein CopC
MKKGIAFALVALALLSTPHIVSAHAIPLACLPRFGITVTKPPAQIICQFSDPLNRNNISMTVTDPNGQRVDKNDTRFYENDDHTLVVSLDTERMQPGIYTVRWQVLDTVDQGLTSGEFQFGVNTVVPPTPTPVLPGVPMTPTPAAPTNNTTTELISRFLIGVGVVVLLAVGVLFWRIRSHPSPLGDGEGEE